MSSIQPIGSAVSRLPVSPVQSVRTAAPQPSVEELAERGKQLTATAVAAQVARPATNEAGKGLIIDFQV